MSKFSRIETKRGEGLAAEEIGNSSLSSLATDEGSVSRAFLYLDQIPDLDDVVEMREVIMEIDNMSFVSDNEDGSAAGSMPGLQPRRSDDSTASSIEEFPPLSLADLGDVFSDSSTVESGDSSVVLSNIIAPIEDPLFELREAESLLPHPDEDEQGETEIIVPREEEDGPFTAADLPPGYEFLIPHLVGPRASAQIWYIRYRHARAMATLELSNPDGWTLQDEFNVGFLHEQYCINMNRLRGLADYFEKIDPLGAYSSSVVVDNLPIGYDCAKIISEFVGSFDVCPALLAAKKATCQSVTARDYTLTTTLASFPSHPTLQETRKLRYILKIRQRIEEEFNEAMAHVAIWENQSSGGAVDDTLTSLKNLVEKLRSVNSIKVSDDFYSCLEGVCLLVAGLSSCGSVVSAIAQICQFARSISGQTCADMAKSYLISMCYEMRTRNYFVNQSGDVEPRDIDDNDNWLTLIKSAGTGWKLLRENIHFSNLQKVLAVVVSLGLCRSSDTNFSIGGVKMFSDAVARKQCSAMDLVDAILVTITSFIEGGYQCFKAGSLRPLFYSDSEFLTLEDKCNRMDRLYEYARTGDTESAEPGMSEAKFFEELEELIAEIRIARGNAREPMAKKILSTRYDRLLKNKVEYERVCNKSGLRVAPWAICLYGESGVGKSALCSILMKTSLLANNFEASDAFIVTDNELDKYDSNMKSSVTGMIIDDLCNTKLELVETVPSKTLVQTLNNTRCHATMADVNEKGKVLKEPKVVVTTTNVKNLQAEEQSECPLSIVRRHHLIITVKVKKEFARKEDGMLDTDKLRSFYVNEMGMDEIPPIPDAWELTAEYAIGAENPTPGRPKVIAYKTIVHNDRPLINVSIREILAYNRDASQEHFRLQRSFVKGQTNLEDKMNWCSECKMPGCYCTCPRASSPSLDSIPEEDEDDDQLEQQSFGLAKFALKMYSPKLRKVFRTVDAISDEIGVFSLTGMTTRIQVLEKNIFIRWTSFIPETWLEDKNVQRAFLACHQHEFGMRVRHRYVMHYLIFLYLCFWAWWFSPWFWESFEYRILYGIILIPPMVYNALKMLRAMHIEKTRLYATLCEDNRSVKVAMEEVRASAVNYITKGCLTLATIYTVVTIWQHVRKVQEPQGNLAPKSMEDIEKRDSEAGIQKTISKEQNWDQEYIAPLPSSEKSKTATTKQLTNLVYKNTSQFTYVNSRGKDAGCDMFFPESNIAIIPRHVWEKSEMKITVSRGSNRKQTYETFISRDHSVDIGSATSDLCLVYVPSAGDHVNLVDYFPVENYPIGRNIPAKFVYKDMRGNIPERMECDTVCKIQEIKMRYDSLKYAGAKYKLDFGTFAGLCMGSLISNTSAATIMGFHTAGIKDEKDGAMCAITRQDYLDARETLADIPGVVVSASTGDFQVQSYGARTFDRAEIHPKSPVNDLPIDAHIDVYGSCPGRATYHSKVVPTPIAEDVAEICGATKVFGKPKFHLGKAWSDTIKYLAKPALGVEPSLLRIACMDYVSMFMNTFDKFPDLKKQVKRLTRMQNVCGQDAVRFIDALNKNTSIGYPLSGPKRDYITLLDPEDVEGFQCPAELDPMFWDEAERMRGVYLEGRRNHVPFKACLKDEPTDQAKDKVRVFQSCPIAFGLLIREYFLPIARVMSLFPLLSECGVGINTMGPEFSEAADHMRKHGPDRIFAGDYSKYDLTLPAQLVLASFDIMIMIAEECGYDPDDITVMRGIATDIAYPLMAYNGDLLGLFGSNPSGQNLTVYINSLCNSLLMRCFYYFLYLDKPGPTLPMFSDSVAALTYGDDFKGSVSEKYPEFNHIAYAAFLKDRGMVLTMPDKTSVPTEYMKDEDADFLKRKNIWCDELKMWRGALDEDSIFKSLTAVLESSAVSLLEQTMMNIDSALREWFAYGKEHYEMRRSQMKLIAEKHHISGGCEVLDSTYEDRMVEYKARYELED